MGAKDLHNDMVVRRAISSTRVTDNTAQVSQIIDRASFESLEFLINIGTVADADATFTSLVEHGDVANLSDAAAVADTELLGVEGNDSIAGAYFDFSNDDEVRKIGYKGGKRYVRLTITPANNTGNADIGAMAVLAGARRGPQTSQS